MTYLFLKTLVTIAIGLESWFYLTKTRNRMIKEDNRMQTEIVKGW